MPVWFPQLLGGAAFALVTALLWRYVDSRDKANEQRHDHCANRMDRAEEKLGEHAVALGQHGTRLDHLEDKPPCEPRG